MYKDKKIIVTGSEGLIGKELVPQLQALGAKVIRLDIKLGHDLSHKANVDYLFNLYGPIDYVFHCMGVKGSPQMTKTRPTNFMVPMLQCDTNVITACQEHKVERMLYTSSIALLNMETDKYPAWAKATGETLIKAMKEQYPNGTKYCVVRPASVYGPHEDWQREGLMFISKMVREAVIEKKGISLWNDGQSVRDVIHAADVARVMTEVLQAMPTEWVGVGGTLHKLYDIAFLIAQEAGVPFTINEANTETDSRTIQRNWTDYIEIKLKEGIMGVVEHVRNNSSNTN